MNDFLFLLLYYLLLLLIEQELLTFLIPAADEPTSIKHTRNKRKKSTGVEARGEEG